ncbi:MAG TPA: hypothetical protein VLR90_16760, partial [Blastocatellia bacterium]|nr:hypothetical protein [Blastocatellia bacterium]
MKRELIEYRRVYYYFLLGAAGSLTGWYLAELCTNTLTSLAQNAVFGALLGGLIGMAIACYDGIITRSFLRFLRFGSTGLSIGGVAGALALVLAQLLYTMMRGQNQDAEIPALQSILVGLPCWLLLGSMIGLGAVINKGAQIY